MSGRKRSREMDLLIKLASGQSLQADSQLLRGLCDSARSLPAAADEWDVSGLLLDGQPFSRETVSCWMNCVNSIADGRTDLGQQDIEQLSTVTGLTQVLAFADAVGSSHGPIKIACSQIKNLKFRFQLPEQPQDQDLPVSGCSYWFDYTKQLQRSNTLQCVDIGMSLESPEQVWDVRCHVAQQTGALLRLAHVLRLQPLLDVLHQFLLVNAQPRDSEGLLYGVTSWVFTDAVLEAALSNSSTLSKEAYVSSVLSQPCSLTPGEIGHSSLIKLVGLIPHNADTNIQRSDVQLLQDFAGARVGDVATLTLDLSGEGEGEGGTLVLRFTPNPQHAGGHVVTMPVQLLLGSTFTDAASLQEYLAPRG